MTIVEALFMAIPRFWPRAGIPMDVAAIDDQIVGDPIQVGLAERAIAQSQDVPCAPLIRAELEQDQCPVVSAGRCSQRRETGGRLDSRQPSAVLRPDAFIGVGQRLRWCGADGDVTRSVLLREDEVANEGGPGRKLDDVTRRGGVEGRLQVRAGRESNDCRSRA